VTNKDKIISLSDEGYNYSEIARLVGVSRQYVTQVLGSRGVGLTDFRKIYEDQCIYPEFRKWWNDNRMTYHKFFALMGMAYHQDNMNRFRMYIKGKGDPRKEYIDKMIAATEIPYERLFSTGNGAV
jgi:hypothetical protein